MESTMEWWPMESEKDWEYSTTTPVMYSSENGKGIKSKVQEFYFLATVDSWEVSSSKTEWTVKASSNSRTENSMRDSSRMARWTAPSKNISPIKNSFSVASIRTESCTGLNCSRTRKRESPVYFIRL